MPTRALKPHSEVCLIPLAPAFCQARPWGSFEVKSLGILGNGDDSPKELAGRISFESEGKRCRVFWRQGRAWRHSWISQLIFPLQLQIALPMEAGSTRHPTGKQTHIYPVPIGQY